jgi:transcription elongation factor/antiterminator RfaH
MVGVHWYTVQTKPRAERQVEAALSGKGLTVYLPLVKVERVNPRARPVVPLFPTYLFVHVDLEEVGQSAVNWVPGVIRLVNFGGEPAAVPDAVIDHVKRRLGEMQKSGEFGLGPFRHGDHVRITTGPLRDLDAVFDQRLSAKGRARVLIEFLGRLTATEVDLDVLEKRDQRNWPR